MFATLIKVVVAIGSLAIAGISAYAAYKRNSGSHTLTNSTSMGGGYYNRPTYAYGYSGGYGYGYNPYRRPSKRISRTGNIDQDLVTHTDSINELYEEVDNIHASVDEILAELKRRGYNYHVKQPRVATVQTPVGPQQVIVDDIMDTNQEKEIARREEAFTDRIVAIFNREYNAYRDSIMRRASAPIPTPVIPTPAPVPAPVPIIPTQDPNVSVIPAPTQPMNQVTYPTHNFNTAPSSDMSMNAINTSYMFNMNSGFEQFYDTDLYRRLCQDRRNGLPTMNPDFQTTQVPTIPTLSPVMNNCEYQQPGINLGTQVLPTLDNMQQIQIPIASYGMPDTSMPTFEKPIDGSDQIVNPNSLYAGVMPSTRKVYSYGHYGEGMPSTRKVYSYSNCY